MFYKRNIIAFKYLTQIKVTKSFIIVIFPQYIHVYISTVYVIYYILYGRFIKNIYYNL